MKISTYLPKSKSAVPMALTMILALVVYETVVSPRIAQAQARRLGVST